MLQPPNFSSSFEDLLKRITQRIQQGKIETRLLDVLQRAYEEELAQEHIVLSRPERKRLFRLAAKAILTDLLAQLDRE